MRPVVSIYRLASQKPITIPTVLATNASYELVRGAPIGASALVPLTTLFAQVYGLLSMGHTDRRHTQTQNRYAANDLEIMQVARRYSTHVFELLRPHLGSRVLEVGSGIGTMSRPVADIVDMVVGIEPNDYCAKRLATVMRGHPRFSLRTCHLEECDSTELATYRFDTVLCVNVLEHIADDVSALRAFRDVLMPNGKVLLFVPAVQGAYGPLDAELGHYRRYSKRTLRKAFSEAGLQLDTLRHTNPIGLVAWMFNAHILKSRIHNLTQVRIFDRLVGPWALPLERLVSPPIGLSLIAVGRRTAAR
jgi:ubiquinone/menaquinone biosynthesis C-methylase UbiE